MAQILTAVLVIITGFYAWVTYRILVANRNAVAAVREQVDALMRPYVTISISPEIGSPHINLKIANTGKSPASSLRLTLDRDFYQFGIKKEEKKLNNFAAFSRQIKGMAPSEEFNIPLAIGMALFDEKADRALTPLTFTVKATYSYSSKTVSEETILDLTPYADALEKTDPVATELQQIHFQLIQMNQHRGGS